MDELSTIPGREHEEDHQAAIGLRAQNTHFATKCVARLAPTTQRRSGHSIAGTAGKNTTRVTAKCGVECAVRLRERAGGAD